MYLDHFQLTVNPFGISPKLDFLYRSDAFEESIAHLIYGLENSEAIVMITGAIGTGKSMAIQSFLTHLSKDFEFALVTNTRVSSLEFLKLVLEDLGIDFPRDCDKSDLLIKFKDFLAETFRQGGRVLIVVDEAQNLDVDVLEEVRLMTNLGQGDSQPVQVILLGQPELCETINRPELAQLRQRIRVHCKLATLTREELEGYVAHRMVTAGGKAGVFSSQALDRIFQFSEGVPRLVNSLCGNALLAAFVAGREKVLPEDVTTEEIPALTDLQHQPVAKDPSPPSTPPAKVQKKPRNTPARKDRSPEVQTYSSRREKEKKSGLLPTLAVLLIVLAAAGVGLWQFGYLDGLFSGSSEAKLHRPESQDHAQLVNPSGAEQPTETDKSEGRTNVSESPGGSEIQPETRENEEVVDREDSSQAAPAEVEIVNPESISTPDEKTAGSPVAPSPRTVFAVHIASFRDQEKTEQYIASISDVAPEHFSRVYPGQGSDWYRIYLGPYQRQAEATAVAERLKESGRIQYFNITRVRATNLVEMPEDQ